MRFSAIYIVQVIKINKRNNKITVILSIVTYKVQSKNVTMSNPSDLSTHNLRITSPTDVYNYAIRDNQYYPKTTVSKRSAIMNNQTDIANKDSSDMENDKFKMINLSKLWIKTENNKQTIYPFAVLLLSAIPVLLMMCTSSVGLYSKTLVIIIYLLMIALTVYLFKK